MGDEDIEMYAPGYIKEAYDEFTDEEKERFCKQLLREMFQLFEEGDSWGFGTLMTDTLAELEAEGVDVLSFKDEEA